MKRIVIVDDDEFIRKTFFLLFSSRYNVYLARDAAEALARFNHVPVDLIITDLRLPQKNGLQMVQEFRQAGYQGKVLLITAYAEQLQPEELVRVGVDKCFVKPLDLKLINETVDRLLMNGQP
ncbi:MAG: response regulator [Candidatus Saccharicenans sp.]